MNTTILYLLLASVGAGSVVINLIAYLLERTDALHLKAMLNERTAWSDKPDGSDQGGLAVGQRQAQASRVKKLTIMASGPATKKGQKGQDRSWQLDSELPALLEICALSMRAGMAFDQAFALAVKSLDGQLVKICSAQLAIWEKGLSSRALGLRQLKAEVNTELFSRFVTTVLRALRFGTPVAPLLVALAEESRRILYAKREEEVAKAPVKMLIPTGALILPAMLLLVLGPIMLDLMGKLG